MAPILGIFASSQQGAAAATSFESIATVSVGSGGSSSIEFTSIPGTFAHLQIRGILRSAYGSDQPALAMKINGSYIDRNHGLYGDGSAAGTYTGTGGNIAHATGNNASANMFSAIIIDILDYANTNKYKTVRVLNGSDRNGSGIIELDSGLEQTTSAVTSILLETSGANLMQYSTLALYGIKGVV